MTFFKTIYSFYILILIGISHLCYAQKKSQIKSLTIITQKGSFVHHHVFDFYSNSQISKYSAYTDETDKSLDHSIQFDSLNNVVRYNFLSIGNCFQYIEEFLYDSTNNLIKWRILNYKNDYSNTYDTSIVTYDYDSNNRLVFGNHFKNNKITPINKWQYTKDTVYSWHYNTNALKWELSSIFTTHFNSKNQFKTVKYYHIDSTNNKKHLETFTVINHYPDGTILLKKELIGKKKKTITLKTKPFSIWFLGNQLEYYEKYKALLDKELKNKENKIVYEYYQQ